MSQAFPCPYPNCTKTVEGEKERHACACDLRQPLASCRHCGIWMRTGARFCRRCRTEPLAATGPLHAPREAVGQITTLAGEFRRAPLFLFGACYAIDREGALRGISLRKGALARLLGSMDAAAASNQAVAVEVKTTGRTQPGWTILGVSPARVQAYSCVTGAVSTLFEAEGEAEIAVNPPGASARFHGIAANGQFFAFAERMEPDRIALTVCSFSGDLPAERVVMIDGPSAMGPVFAEDVFALCTSSMLGLYDLRSRKPFYMPLPPQFEPMLARKRGELHVSPGSMPLTVSRTPEGMTAWIVGEHSGRPGVMAINIERRGVQFEDVSLPASVCSNAEGSLCIAAGSEVRVLGGHGAATIRRQVRPGMPAMSRKELLFSFAATGAGNMHSIVLSGAGETLDTILTFEDAQCRPETCCGILVSAGEVVVPFFDGDTGSGLKLAHQSLEV